MGSETIVSNKAGSTTGKPTQKRHWLRVPLDKLSARILVRHWYREGSDNRKKLFVLHGLTGTGMDFRYLAANLAASGWHVYAPDLLVHGASSKFGHSDAYSLSNLFYVLNALVKRFATPGVPASFLGSSMGSGLVAAFLAARSTRADAVMLNDNALEFDSYLKRCIEYLRGEPRRFPTRKDAMAQLVRRNRELFHQADDDRVGPRVMWRLLNSRIEVANDGCRFNFDRAFIDGGGFSMDRYPDFFPIISKIDAARIMLMFGEHSPYRSSKVVDRLLRERHNIELRVIEGSGHPPRLLSPPDVEIVRKFLEGAPASDQ